MSAFDKHIGHRKHWAPGEISKLLHDAGFSTVRANGAGFPFFNLYRCVVILRGTRLIDDVRAGSGGQTSLAARAVMSVFNRLIRKRMNSSVHGWQMIATARS